jgi:hypothetical protein
MGGTRRPYNLPQTEIGSDVAFGVSGPNTATVVGILGMPLNTASFSTSASRAYVFTVDPNYLNVNVLPTLPVSTIPDTYTALFAARVMVRC